MGLFTLFGETARNLFRPPATEDYPRTPKVYVAGSRGHVAIEVSKCTLCMVCEKRCPTRAIAVDRAAKSWSIEQLRCIQCSFCAEMCPKKCLVLEAGYAPVRASGGLQAFAVPFTPRAPAAVRTAPDAAAAAG